MTRRGMVRTAFGALAGLLGVATVGKAAQAATDAAKSVWGVGPLRWEPAKMPVPGLGLENLTIIHGRLTEGERRQIRKEAAGGGIIEIPAGYVLKLELEPDANYG
jgi:hypothetical protein